MATAPTPIAMNQYVMQQKERLERALESGEWKRTARNGNPYMFIRLITESFCNEADLIVYALFDEEIMPEIRATVWAAFVATWDAHYRDFERHLQDTWYSGFETGMIALFRLFRKRLNAEVTRRLENVFAEEVAKRIDVMRVSDGSSFMDAAIRRSAALRSAVAWAYVWYCDTTDMMASHEDLRHRVATAPVIVVGFGAIDVPREHR